MNHATIHADSLTVGTRLRGIVHHRCQVVTVSSIVEAANERRVEFKPEHGKRWFECIARDTRRVFRLA